MKSLSNITCEAVQYSDLTVCDKCDLRWDTNDYDAPKCKKLSRESKDQYFLKIAKLVSTRATCPRRSVGCVIINEYGHIIATGFNGVPRGYPHCTDEPCGGENCKSGESLNKCMATHAEQNALLQCKNIMEIDTLYVTTSPCDTCCKLIANTSCKRVVFYELYPHSEGLDLLKKLNIEVIHERIED